LDGTFERKAFGSFLNLIPISEQVTKLSAVCMICQEEGAFTKRLSAETEVKVIGGADKYIAACRRCYQMKIPSPSSPSSPVSVPSSPVSSPVSSPDSPSIPEDISTETIGDSSLKSNPVTKDHPQVPEHRISPQGKRKRKEYD